MDELKTQTEKALAKIAKSKKAVKDLPKTGDYLFFKIKKEIVKIISELFNDKVIKTSDLNISLPPCHIKADLSLEIFSLSKMLGLDPKKVSKELGLVINKNKTKFIESATPAGPYLNLKLKKDVYGEALAETAVLKEKYGKNDKNKNKLVIIDFSSPNIAKPMSVGHLRSTVLGQALANIYEATGYVAVRDNHIGDWGTQFGKLIYAYQTWGDEKTVAKNPIAELNKLYIKFNEEASKDPELDDNAREIFSNLEKGDGKIKKLWEKFSKLSIKEFDEVYDILGIKFDTYLGESYFAKDAEDEVKKALEKNLARKDEESDAIVVDTLLGVPSFLLRKQDGSTLYISRDLAKIKFRIANFKPDIILYVVGQEQKLNFAQLFELVKHIGYSNKTELKHICFGLVTMDGAKMSTRKGSVVELKELINQSVAMARELILEKNKDISEKELAKTAEIIGVGSIIYNDLRQSKEKNISFDWKKMLNFSGGSAVYLQYTYARIKSILKKASGEVSGKPIFEDEDEFNLAKKIIFFPHVVLEARKHDSPHLIATYMEELAQLFNSFYNSVQILGTEDEELKNSRLALIASVATVIKNGLTLLNIKTSDKI